MLHLDRMVWTGPSENRCERVLKNANLAKGSKRVAMHKLYIFIDPHTKLVKLGLSLSYVLKHYDNKFL